MACATAFRGNFVDRLLWKNEAGDSLVVSSITYKRP